MMKKGVLYPITHSFVKKSVEVPATPFSITINSGADSSFILPTVGRLNDTYNSYEWVVSWGDGTIEEVSGMGGNGAGIVHNYQDANTLYDITIAPQSADEMGWLRAFGFHDSWSGSGSYSNKTKVVLVDGQLTEKMIRITDTDRYVCSFMFDGCSNLTMGESFQLPQGITSVGDYFCSYMFRGCKNLTMGTSFQLPQWITNVGDGFCYYMFYDCANLTMNSIFQLPQGITSVGDDFCSVMLDSCPSLTMNSIFQLPQGITSVGDDFCVSMFYRCTSLTMNSVFQLPQGITDIGDYFCYYMFSGCTSITMNSIFQLPQGITSAGAYFCETMFEDCTSLTMNEVFQLPQGITSAGREFCLAMFDYCTSLTLNDIFQLPQGLTDVGVYFCGFMFDYCESLTTGVRKFFGNVSITDISNDVYRRTFHSCTSITETLSDIPQLQVIPSYYTDAFRGCPADLIEPLHEYWK